MELSGRPLSQAGRDAWRLLSHRVTVFVACELLALAVLIGAIVVVFWPMLAGVGVYAESDTFTFFYPVFAQLHASLRAGELPLWTPNVFGGFPLFAEGQIGALYPPGLLAAQLGSPVEGFLLLRVFHVGGRDVWRVRAGAGAGRQHVRRDGRGPDVRARELRGRPAAPREPACRDGLAAAPARLPGAGAGAAGVARARPARRGGADPGRRGAGDARPAADADGCVAGGVRGGAAGLDGDLRGAGERRAPGHARSRPLAGGRRGDGDLRRGGRGA